MPWKCKIERAKRENGRPEPWGDYGGKRLGSSPGLLPVTTGVRPITMTGKVASMTLTSFSKRYGFTERRQSLIDLMSKEISRIAAQEGEIRCVVFGSLINKAEPEPNDIDAIISVSTNRMPQEWLHSTKKWHTFPVRTTPPASPAEPEQMIACFNDLEEGFRLEEEDCIEVIFDGINS